MQKFERAEFEVAEYVESENYGKFILSPLERGYGTTIGNALRRVLLSSLPGAAIFAIKVDGVYHEFTTIPGVREDVSMIILQLKQLIMKIEDDEVYTLQISAKGPCTVTAGDIICPAQVEVLNKDLEIAHLEKGAVLEMEQAQPRFPRNRYGIHRFDLHTGYPCRICVRTDPCRPGYQI